MIRIFDFYFSLFGLVLLSPLLLIVWVIAWFDNGSPLFFQERVGRHKKPFMLVKFRTMPPDTLSIATHFADASTISQFGFFLRRSKLDELPQLFNVVRGEMSLVGPRPCLFNQEKLITQRASLGVFNVRPGITGLAQIQGIDMSTPNLLAKTDAYMISQMSIKNYFKYIFLTIVCKGQGDKVFHK